MTVDKGTCRGCGKDILWIKNENGNAEPFDSKPCRTLTVEGGALGEPHIQYTHLPHFVTCKKADDFRKGGK